MVEDIPQTAARDVPSLLGSAVRDGPALAQGAAPALFSLLQDTSRVFNLETNAVCRTPKELETPSYRFVRAGGGYEAHRRARKRSRPPRLARDTHIV